MRLENICRALLPAALLVCSAGAKAQTPLGGVGILGDSSSDEFRADDNRGGSYSATTLNWAELLVTYRSLNLGAWGVRSEPRRAGYSYNWARSGATAEEVVSGGQADGLAAQVAAGKVSTIVLMVGANDFALWNGTYAEVYDGTLSGESLSAKIRGIVESLRLAVNKVQVAGAAKIFVATLADRGTTPAFLATFPDPLKRQRVTDAIIAVNVGIRQMASANLVEVVDLFSYGQSLLPRIDASGNLDVGGEQISAVTPGDEPHHLVLGDNEHVGTVASGLIANYFIASFAAAGIDIAPFTDQEMLANAGIKIPRLDTVAPSITLTTPAPNATVSGTVNLAAIATDNIGVKGVQFRIDAAALGGEDVKAPYSASWNSAIVSNGTHTISATARDEAGNVSAASVSAIVSNPAIARPESATVSSGTFDSGTLSSLVANDNNYFVVRSTKSGVTRYATTTFGFGRIPSSTARLDFSVIAKSSASGTTMKAWAFDAAANAWVLVTSVVVATAESTSTLSIGSGASRFVDSSGVVRLRIEQSRLWGNFSAYHDQVTLATR